MFASLDVAACTPSECPHKQKKYDHFDLTMDLDFDSPLNKVGISLVCTFNKVF